MKKNIALMKAKMIHFLQEEVTQRGFDRVVFGLSGGIDSAVVAYLCREAFGKHAKALLMPSLRGSHENFQDAKMLTELLRIPYEVITLEPYEKVFCEYQGMDNVRYGNFCARVRMMLLYDKSQEEQALVIGTSNKSERLLGYGTIHGDLACAINPIGDLFKTEIFEFAKFLNLPQKIIDKKPSADLYEGQNDEEEIGYSYEEIDTLLSELDRNELIYANFKLVLDRMKNKYPNALLETVLNLVRKNRFKTERIKIFKLEDYNGESYPILP